MELDVSFLNKILNFVKNKGTDGEVNKGWFELKQSKDAEEIKKYLDKF